MRIAFIILLTLFYSCRGVSQSFEGAWKGDLAVPTGSLPLHFSLQKGDTWTGTMRSPSQTRLDFKLNVIEVAGDSIHLQSAALGMSYKGRISADGEHVEGTFRQGNYTAPLRLGRYDSTQTVKRPQEPVAPFPYNVKEVTFENTASEVTLAGTLTQPKAPGKYPALILVSGSGPQNRNSELEGHKPFEVLADYLTRQGVVVLRYDDRGVAQSTGNFLQSNIGDFSRDALAGLRFLKAQATVDSTRVGMIGHSEGGLISLLLAGQHAPDLKFIVSLAGPSLPIDSLMVLQLYHVGKSQGMSEKQLAKVRPINRKNFEVVKSDLPAPKAMTQLLENMKSVGGASGTLRKELQVMLLEPYRYFMRIDPVPFIQKINIPLYAAFGEKDVQVPAKENQESLVANLAGNPQSRIKTYANLNHLLQPAKTGGLQEYYTIETTIDPTLLKDIADWIKGL
ncbi:alpha/beta hydrolase family protein [Sphingobacterium corticibacter]|uniref:Alpha/beta hydrolase n=1 Tax=Sphingobacterium corticibacter TaxID=2171749 RepID=A0A2T8HHK7_9SPHI|nr:alpha/beta fold hydrolase [Sphingobacterium corticibacter]PVH24927.1 alpha/beta hydrolase [Sphingobacterium corticibacter]